MSINSQVHSSTPVQNNLTIDLGMPEVESIKPRALIVDDDPMIRSLLSAILKRSGYETEVAKDGFAGFEKATQSHFDLIVSDLRMPGMWGTELYQKLKETKPELADRMIFATSESLSGDLAQFFQSSGRPYLRKPFSNDEVRRLAAEVCAS